jgi:two-component system, chemotaxis family, CheB/CheR fusion protein
MSHHDDQRFLEGLRVLLVEDSDDVRDILALLLGADGAAVRTARSARSALAAAAEWDFDVLLTDIGLPDLPGDRLIREILGMKAARPRVIVVTGFGAPHAALARRAGAEVVFTKPLDWSALREHLAARPAVAAA